MHHTIREAQALRDYSNQTLRFNRSMKEAGMRGPIGSRPTPAGKFWIGYAIVLALIAAAVWG